MMVGAVDQIKQSVTMRDVCQQYGISVSRAGFACCPFHGERTASMKIYDGDRGYHCFGCHRGGDVIDFVMNYFGLSFIDAVRKIDQDFGLNLQTDRQARREELREARRVAYQRRIAERVRKEQRRRLQMAYDEALERFIKLDDLAHGIPPEGLEDLTDDVAYAMKNFDRAYYELQEAEANLRQFDDQSVGKSSAV